MANVVIRVENLAKSYTIGHKPRERYTALRDVLAEKVRAVSSRILHPLQTRADNAGQLLTEEFFALKDLSFEVKSGDRIGIIGRNGAGKSTLLKVLSRITEPTRGRIEIDGRVASLLEVGTGFHPELTGRENIFLNGAILGMGRAEIRRKFDEIVAFAEVERFLDTPVKRYSSGMYVRLAFAVAAHLEPEILIVDEVLAVGDAQFQKKCLGKMEEVGREGRTIVFVSHDMTAVKALCNEVMVLSAGTMVGRGDADQQIHNYLRQHAGSQNESSKRRVKIGDNIELQEFSFAPNPVRPAEPLGYQIVLKAFEKNSIQAMVIVIYDTIGVRLAIVDLRKSSNPYVVEKGESLRISGSIAGLPLVDGDYSIAFYIDTGEVRQEYKNLVDISVVSPAEQRDFAPYPSRVSGYIRLGSDYEVSISGE